MLSHHRLRNEELATKQSDGQDLHCHWYHCSVLCTSSNPSVSPSPLLLSLLPPPQPSFLHTFPLLLLLLALKEVYFCQMLKEKILDLGIRGTLFICDFVMSLDYAFSSLIGILLVS